MTHPDSDTLLRYVLETLDDAEKSVVSMHLNGCEACAAAEKKIRADVLRLANAGSDMHVPAPPPLPRRREKALSVSRWAAVLAAGFLIGYITSDLTSALPAIPVQQHLIPRQITEDTLGFVPCEAVNIAPRGAGRY